LDISCIVLAGGKGLRLGRDKTLETINDKYMLQQTISRLSFFNGNIIIVTAEKRPFPHFNGYLKLTVVTDIYPGKGPLGGIYTGLVTSGSDYNLVVACDMPFLNQSLLQYMIQLSANCDLVVPRWDGMVEPLHAVYAKTCQAPIESLLKKDSLNIAKLFTLVKTRYVEAAEIDKFDPEHLSFFNINTETDLKMARELNEENKK
jgi:molybdopterin-guanine dinucleotide biosynthesis protein A